MATPTRYNVLASHSNLPLKASGQPVFKSDQKYPYNVLSGEIVLFNARTNMTMSAADLAAATDLTHVSLAVGVGKKGELASDLRTLTGALEEPLCRFDMKGSATAPKCALPQIVDSFFSCVDADKAYAIQIDLDDDFVRSNFQMNEPATYHFGVGTLPEGPCEDCDVTRDCEDIIDDLIARINNDFEPDFQRFSRRNSKNRYQPFKAVRLYNKATSIKRFCLDKVEDDCGKCANTAAVKGINIGGTVTEFTGTFVGTGADAFSTPGHLESLVSEINALIEPDGGYAVLTTSIGPCCGTGIEISTNSDDDFLLVLEDDSTVAPCEELNPFPAGEDGCGFRLIADPVSVECHCDLPPDQAKGYLGRTLKVNFVGDNWNKTSTVVAQEQVLPEGLGYFYQNKERFQHNGGLGRDFRQSDIYRGRTTKRPDKFSRVNSGVVECDKAYCAYNLQLTSTDRAFHSNHLLHGNTQWVTFLIPSSDENTKTDFEAVLAALAARNICSTASIEC